MATFPTLSRTPGVQGYIEDTSKDAVNIASKASGLPVVNKLFTFDPKTWKYSLFLVSQADKETIAAFYEANKDVPFSWYNYQESETYEVIFDGPPAYSLDKIKMRWHINLMLVQYSPL